MMSTWISDRFTTLALPLAMLAGVSYTTVPKMWPLQMGEVGGGDQARGWVDDGAFPEATATPQCVRAQPPPLTSPWRTP